MTDAGRQLEMPAFKKTPRAHLVWIKKQNAADFSMFVENPTIVCCGYSNFLIPRQKEQTTTTREFVFVTDYASLPYVWPYPWIVSSSLIFEISSQLTWHLL